MPTGWLMHCRTLGSFVSIRERCGLLLVAGDIETGSHGRWRSTRQSATDGSAHIFDAPRAAVFGSPSTSQAPEHPAPQFETWCCWLHSRETTTATTMTTTAVTTLTYSHFSPFLLIALLRLQFRACTARLQQLQAESEAPEPHQPLQREQRAVIAASDGADR